jgi:MoxR-like ATPase
MAKATPGTRPCRKAAAADPAPVAALPIRRDLISRLGLVGLASLEPVVLASLAAQSALLLIGSHGSGKSLLLERVADALGLRWRHYNAALVNFDDLVGYPLPDANGQLRFVETPASVWGAQAVFVDEISRARLDVQNRLFPIIHERRVQGIPLPDLQHRWAAMNPPATDGDDDPGYLGSQPLDIALSDRFALQASMPDWRSFDEPQQEAVIRAPELDPDPMAGPLWSAAIARTRELLPMVRAQWGSSIARYVRILAALLAESGSELSARRAGMLSGNLAAVHAARLCADPAALIDDSAWVAALNSMPFAASGQKFDNTRLLACHREAWRQAAAKADDPMGHILAERDPIARVRLALAATELPDGELTTIVTDALHAAADGARHALAEWLFESGAVARLSVLAADAVAEVYRDVACVQEVTEQVSPNGLRHRIWKTLQQRLGAEAATPLTERKGNLLASLFSANRLAAEEDVDAVLRRYADVRERFDAGRI